MSPSANTVWLDYFKLAKAKIAIAVAVTVLVGGFLYRGAISLPLVFAVFGAMLLAAGGGALNQWQERDIDAKMARTRSRPLPAGRISPRAALIFSMVLIIGGALTLYFGASFEALTLGLFALLWYNIVYVFLKRKTAFAVIPGAWIGAIGPLIGWVAAGGDVGNPRILIVALFLGVWQAPHFWLLVLLAGDDYEQAGLPSLRKTCTPRQLALLTQLWILAAGAGSASLAFVGPVLQTGWIIKALLIVNALLLVVRAGLLSRRIDSPPMLRRAFHHLNFFVLIAMALLCLARFFPAGI
jgi:protoheme IX farnesyltransferase